MSKDIRSFFTVKSSPANKNKTSNAKEITNKFGQRKRPAIVIDSDSDEELNVKRTKSLADNKKSMPNNKNEVKKVTSKYFSEEKVNANDIFGARPIKRDNSRNIVKKTGETGMKEFHIDKDFESELMLVDGLDKELLTKNETELNDKQESNAVFDTRENNSKKERKLNPNLKIRTDNLEYSEIPNKKVKLEKEENSSENKETLSNLNDVKITSSNTIKTNNKKESPSKKSPIENSSSKETKSESQSANTSPFKRTSPLNKKISQDTSLKKLNGCLESKTAPLIWPESKNKESNNKKQFTDEINKSVKKDYSPQKNSNISVQEKSADSGIDVDIHNISNAFSNLWVERYKPTTTKQIIGQQGEKSCVNKLTTWLKNWDKNHSGNKKLLKPSPWAKNDDGAYFKAALLSGPPGVGKTTTAHLVSKELGFDVVEFNASDTRSKKLLHQEVSELLSTKSLSPYFTGKGEQVTKKHVLLMDEVDGMAGNEDRGGLQEMIVLIKQARVPIICMCNDRNHPKIRSLSNYCFDLRFSKPRAEQIRGAMMSVCFKEKLKLTSDVLTDIITSANQDIRLIINHLSMLSMEKSSLANSTKHIKMGPWDFTRKIFSEEEHKSMSIFDKCDLFFHDYNLTPLFVQENYLNAVPHKLEAKNKIKKMELFASAARSLSLGDLTEKSIRSHNAWGLLPVQAVFSSLVPGDILEGHIGAQISFPAWFGKNSRQSKMSRLLQELTVHSRLKISGNKEAMNLDYLMPLEKTIVLPLVKLGLDGIPQALSVLSEYCLVREDLESISELSSWPNTKNQFSEVESKVKAAFTRAYNKTSAPTPYAAVPIKKGTKTEVDNLDSIPEDEDMSQDIEDEEDESLEVDAMIVVKKPSTKKVDKEVKPSTSKGTKNAKRGRKK